MRVTVLGSGSRGNAIVVDGADGTLLIDAGFGRRALARRFALAERRPEEVGALLLTHEHVDHASGATAASDRWQWPVFAHAETFTALSAMIGGSPVRRNVLSMTASTHIAGFDVVSVPVPHDARLCSAFVLTDRRTGARVGIALDLGHVPEHLPAALAHCDLLVVESNHDERMLAQGPYPWALKRRVGGPTGHLSNGTTAGLLAAVAHRGLRGVVLAHLSETNNRPTTALERSRQALRRAGWRREELFAAVQQRPSTPVTLAGAGATGGSDQLVLQL
ncbi:MAG: MBL fold metallo-hydrolase [Gemmatimonadaceae bacterium]|nr:MBL fold metallo-hydrolase [Gemmatimonadaceae bacterium]